MDKSRIKNWIFAVLSVLVAVFSVVLYLTLIKQRASGALMYSLDLVWIVVTVSALSSFILFLTLRSFPKGQEESFCDEPDDYREDTEAYEEFEVQTESIDEYPELFLREGAEERDWEPHTFRDAVQKAIDSLRVAEEAAEAEADTVAETDPLAELYGIGSFDGECDSASDDSIYKDLPDTLPEGYTCFVEEDEEYEEEEAQEEDCDEFESRSLVGGIVLRVVFVILLLSVSVLTAYLSSYSYGAYYKDGVERKNVLYTVRYEWRDSIYYEISPSFFGDSLCVSFQTDDGGKIELMPSSLVLGEEFSKEYPSVYSYVVDACEKMDAAGAKKSVKERKTIEGKFTHREDIGEYVEKLIRQD